MLLPKVKICGVLKYEKNNLLPKVKICGDFSVFLVDKLCLMEKKKKEQQNNGNVITQHNKRSGDVVALLYTSDVCLSE